MKDGMVKYKCLDCGHRFEGDMSTMECPECGSNNIVIEKGGIGNWPWKKILIAIFALIAIVLLILLLKDCHTEKDYSIAVSQDSINVYVEAICTNDSLDMRELRDSCQVIVLDSNDVQMDNPRLFSLKSNKMNFEISMFEPGCTYKVSLCKRKGGKELCSASFAIPLPPSPPIIVVEPAVPETDPKDKCRLLGTYKVVIVVKEGTADKYSIDGVEYNSNIITGVKPRPRNSQYVIVRAYNSEDKLWSDSISYKLPPINRNALVALEKDEVQRFFDKVARRDMYAGDAVDSIAKGISIPVITNSGKSDLENVLQVSYQGKKRLKVKKVNYKGNECSRTIVSIEI